MRRLIARLRGWLSRPAELELQVRRLPVQPGDAVVISCSRPLSAEIVARIKSAIAGLGVSAPVLVLDAGMKLMVLEGACRPQQQAD